MIKRSAILIFVGLGLGCGPSASQKKSEAPKAEESDSDRWSTPTNVSLGQAKSEAPNDQALPVLPFDEAKKRADAHWLAADTEKSNAAAWDQAGEALALAAQASAEDPSAATPLLKGALAAWSNSEKLAPARANAAGDAKERLPLPRKEALRIAVLVQLAGLTDPQSPELAMIHYRHGRVLWNHAHYTEAAERFVLVVEQFPDKQEAKLASGLLLDALLRAGELEQLQKRANWMLKNKALVTAHPELKETLVLVRHQAARSDARKLVDAAQYKECAEAFLALFERDKSMPSVNGDELLYNASVCLERSKQNKRAIKVLRQLIRLFPQSQFAEGARTRADALAAQP